MPISKKARVQREHKAAEKAGTRAPVKPNGLPVKAPKPTSIVRLSTEVPFTSAASSLEALLHQCAMLNMRTEADEPQCANCRKEIVNTNKTQLEVHAATHNEKLWPKEKCWPNDFPATA